MTKQAIESSHVAKPFGAYSTAVLKGDMLFLSGHGPFDENQQLIGKDDFAIQTHKTMQNIRYVLEDNGFHMDDIVRSTVYLSDISHWVTFNEIYGQYFNPPYPTRCVVECKLNGFMVEIECTAIKG
ncbi:RidA family protein [Cohnella silvisoli]|uniref:RidA family protein n=1 Tax=Cohnella silvisoli TaxID=2873699 RepID=A0ABV1L3J8_9BACL|nr:RidA family protein [Cohnella silvisoli]MCD9026246.1 RidA family protein [Cohnella silvisoli]